MMIIIIFSKWLTCSIWPIDGMLTGTITPGQSGTRCNGNEGVLYIPQSSLSDAH